MPRAIATQHEGRPRRWMLHPPASLHVTAPPMSVVFPDLTAFLEIRPDDPSTFPDALKLPDSYRSSSLPVLNMHLELRKLTNKQTPDATQNTLHVPSFPNLFPGVRYIPQIWTCARTIGTFSGFLAVILCSCNISEKCVCFYLLRNVKCDILLIQTLSRNFIKKMQCPIKKKKLKPLLKKLS